MKRSELKQLIREEIKNVMEITPEDNKNILKQLEVFAQGLVDNAKSNNLSKEAIDKLQAELNILQDKLAELNKTADVDPNNDQDMLRNLGWNA